MCHIPKQLHKRSRSRGIIHRLRYITFKIFVNAIRVLTGSKLKLLIFLRRNKKLHKKIQQYLRPRKVLCTFLLDSSNWRGNWSNKIVKVLLFYFLRHDQREGEKKQNRKPESYDGSSSSRFLLPGFCCYRLIAAVKILLMMQSTAVHPVLLQK